MDQMSCVTSHFRYLEHVKNQEEVDDQGLLLDVLSCLGFQIGLNEVELKL